MELDLGAVRAFLAVVDDGHFTDAADRLGMTQQAVSKRIARLESDLGAPLLTRAHTGARLTEDGADFLPHARALISLADQAAGMVRARRRALRIDALARDAAPSDLVRSFYETSDVAVDLVVSQGRDRPKQTALTDRLGRRGLRPLCCDSFSGPGHRARPRLSGAALRPGQP